MNSTVPFQCAQGLPENKPRYVMGVGYPLDIVLCSALGADMYDCVYPTRTARFGTALTDAGVVKLHNANMGTDHSVVDEKLSLYPYQYQKMMSQYSRCM